MLDRNVTTASAKRLRASMFLRNIKSKYCPQDLNQTKGKRHHILNRKKFVGSIFLSICSSYTSKIFVIFT